MRGSQVQTGLTWIVCLALVLPTGKISSSSNTQTIVIVKGLDNDADDVLEGIRRAAVTLQYYELLNQYGYMLEDPDSVPPSLLEQLTTAQEVCTTHRQLIKACQMRWWMLTIALHLGLIHIKNMVSSRVKVNSIDCARMYTNCHHFTAILQASVHAVLLAWLTPLQPIFAWPHCRRVLCLGIVKVALPQRGGTLPYLFCRPQCTAVVTWIVLSTIGSRLISSAALPET